MSTENIIKVATEIATPEFVDAGWFSYLTIMTPDSEKYFEALSWLGYTGEINMVPDRTGIVSTLVTGDGTMNAIVGFHGERPAKSSSDDESDGIDDSDIEDED